MNIRVISLVGEGWELIPVKVLRRVKVGPLECFVHRSFRSDKGFEAGHFDVTEISTGMKIVSGFGDDSMARAVTRAKREISDRGIRKSKKAMKDRLDEYGPANPESRP